MISSGCAASSVAELAHERVVLGVGDLGPVERRSRGGRGGRSARRSSSTRFRAAPGTATGARIARPFGTGRRCRVGRTTARAGWASPAPEGDEEGDDAEGDGEPQRGAPDEQGRGRRLGERRPEPGQEPGEAPLRHPETARQHRHGPRERRERVDERRDAERLDDPEAVQDQGERETLEEPRDDGQPDCHRQRARRQERAPAVDEQPRGLDQASGQEPSGLAADGRRT